MARPAHDASEGGYKLHDDDSERTEMVANLNARAASKKQWNKLRPTPKILADIDENKIPPEAATADESVDEE